MTTWFFNVAKFLEIPPPNCSHQVLDKGGMLHILTQKIVSKICAYLGCCGCQM
jgi:hypothetical protein